MDFVVRNKARTKLFKPRIFLKIKFFLKYYYKEKELKISMEERKNQINLGDEIQIPANKFLAELEKKAEIKEDFATDLENPTFQACLQCWGCFTGWLATWVCGCCCEAPYRRIPEAHWAVITEFGKYTRTLPPGLHYINPKTEQVFLVYRRDR